MAGSHEVRGSIPLCSTKFSQASGIVAGLFPFKTDYQPTVTDQVLGSDGAVALAVATATHLARLIKLALREDVWVRFNQKTRLQHKN